MSKQLIPLASTIVLMPATAQAYIGPGMGLGLVASILGLVAVFFMVLMALIWFPLKRKLRQSREMRQARATDVS